MTRYFLAKAAATAVLSMIGTIALADGNVHENGIGPDPDGDTNPATRTFAIANVGANDVRLDSRFKVIDFERPGGNGDIIRAIPKYGVTFPRPVTRQICDGPRYFRYDSICTYYAPASGAYAAYYRDDWSRPLVVDFKRPICAFAVSVYPIGGREDEVFEATIRAWKDNETPLQPARIRFSWSQNTLKWHVMAGAFFLDQPASRVEIDVEGRKARSDVEHFLIDDVAFSETGCADILDFIKKEGGFESSADCQLITKSAAGGG